MKNILVMGSGSFAHSMGRILQGHGVETSTYLTNPLGHYPASLVGPVYTSREFPNPCGLIRKMRPDFVLPVSIDWAKADWCDEFLAMNIPILAPNPEGIRIERERDFARSLCAEFGIPFPTSFVARNRLEAEAILKEHPSPFVIKNPLCSPTSPIHTIVCETVEETRAWLPRLDYAEGIFLQEYLGRREAGHIAFVSGGEIYSLVTNQEYKRAFTGNMGIVAESPMGGVLERDTEDKYGLARELLKPLLPWFRKIDFHGPIQATAIQKNGVWHTVEYNVRLGVTCSALILRMLENPVDVIFKVATNQRPELKWKPGLNFGGSLHLAGYGFPYHGIPAPALPVSITSEPTCDVWWHFVDCDSAGTLKVCGPRIADICAFGSDLDSALESAYENIRKIQVAGSFYRTDVGKCLWPPGSD